MNMKKKAGRASRADMNSIIALATNQAKTRVETIGSEDVANVSGGDSGGEGSGGGIGGLIGSGVGTAGMVDTDPPGGTIETIASFLNSGL